MHHRTVTFFPRLPAVVLADCLLLIALAGCGRVVQVARDEAVFQELDALYTAVTSKRQDLLDECQARLAGLHEHGHLSDAGYAQINKTVEPALEGDWSESAQRLYKFMRAQRK